MRLSSLLLVAATGIPLSTATGAAEQEIEANDTVFQISDLYATSNRGDGISEWTFNISSTSSFPNRAFEETACHVIKKHNGDGTKLKELYARNCNRESSVEFSWVQYPEREGAEVKGWKLIVFRSYFLKLDNQDRIHYGKETGERNFPLDQFVTSPQGVEHIKGTRTFEMKPEHTIYVVP